jgi:hypothetical protein
MKTNNKFSVTLGFLAGVAVTLAVMLSFYSTQDARAWSPGVCLQYDLEVVGNTGIDPDPKYVVYYQIPACFANDGYAVEKVYLQSGNVAVEYVKQ